MRKLRNIILLCAVMHNTTRQQISKFRSMLNFNVSKNGKIKLIMFTNCLNGSETAIRTINKQFIYSKTQKSWEVPGFLSSEESVA